MLQSLLNEARQTLVSALAVPIEEARVDAHILLREALGVTRAWMIANADHRLSDDQLKRFQGMLQRRIQGEPVAYILGHREFYGLDFGVAPGVLIPRPDTETLVEAALARIPEHTQPLILDLGTGSGAIAIAIAIHRPDAEVTAVDQSEAALAMARHNAEKLGARHLRLIQGDWFSALGDAHFDLIVSNPPYIAEADPHLSLGDLRFEPSTALVSGKDGLDAIRRIASEAPRHLNRGGWLLLEHGYDQAEEVAKLLVMNGFDKVAHVCDLAGIQRVTLGKYGQAN